MTSTWEEKAMAPLTPVLLPRKSHGRRSLVGCSPRGCEESGMTEWLDFDFSLSCVGEGNGNPLQCSCLENPRDGEAWWAAVYGVTQSRTRLKRLSSSSSSSMEPGCCNSWSLCIWSLCPATREATTMTSPHTTTKSRPCSLQQEKADVLMCSKEDPVQPNK